jgi:hypothetical protein
VGLVLAVYFDKNSLNDIFKAVFEILKSENCFKLWNLPHSVDFALSFFSYKPAYLAIFS